MIGAGIPEMFLLLLFTGGPGNSDVLAAVA